MKSIKKGSVIIKMVKEHLIINEIEKVCDLEIRTGYKISIIKKIIEDWRKE